MPVAINIDGEIGGPEESFVSVLDRGFLYGDSVYEVVRTYDRAIFAFGEHMDRLEQSASRLGIALPARDWLCLQVDATIRATDSTDCYCRIIVTRGPGPLTLDPTTASTPTTVIIAKPYEPFPDWTYEEGVKVLVPSIRRTSRASLDPAIKSGNYLNSVLALGEAKAGGYFDALMLDDKGFVTEATTSNVFIAIGGALFTPALEYGLLAGVTRGLLFEVCREAGIACEQKEISLDELLSADEVMLTSTLREVQPVVRVNGDPIADGRPGPVSARLRALFREHVARLIAKAPAR